MLAPPFDQLPNTAISHHSCVAGERIFSQASASSALYYLISGEVHLLRFGSDGTQVMIHRAFSGDFFAEASLFSASYHCDAVSQTDCRLVRLDKTRVLAEIENNPTFSAALSAHFAHQVQSYRRLLELRAIKSADERVLAAIDAGLMGGNIKAFANEIDLTHEATYRALAKATSQGKLIKTGRGQYQRNAGQPSA
jgi:CRP-like cAMP-binding protein